MCECHLSSALLSCLTGQGGTPLNLVVTLTPSDEVVALRSRVAELERQLADFEVTFNRTQYRYMCEVQLNLQLQDLMRRAGVSFPRRLCTTDEVPDWFMAHVTKAVAGDSGAFVSGT